jgi:hypothetical protein
LVRQFAGRGKIAEDGAIAIAPYDIKNRPEAVCYFLLKKRILSQLRPEKKSHRCVKMLFHAAAFDA